MQMDRQLTHRSLLKPKLKLKHRLKPVPPQKLEQLRLPLLQKHLLVVLIHRLVQPLSTSQKWSLTMVSLLMYLIREMEHNARWDRLLRFNTPAPSQQTEKYSIRQSQPETPSHLQLEKIEWLDAGKMQWFNLVLERKQILDAHHLLPMGLLLNLISQPTQIWFSTSKLSLANDNIRSPC